MQIFRELLTSFGKGIAGNAGPFWPGAAVIDLAPTGLVRSTDRIPDGDAGCRKSTGWGIIEVQGTGNGRCNVVVHEQMTLP